MKIALLTCMIILMVGFPAVSASPPTSPPVSVTIEHTSLVPEISYVIGRTIKINLNLPPTTPPCFPVLNLGNPTLPYVVHTYNSKGMNGVVEWTTGTDWQFFGTCN
jgi:hypothetical protein